MGRTARATLFSFWRICTTGGELVSLDSHFSPVICGTSWPILSRPNSPLWQFQGLHLGSDTGSLQFGLWDQPGSLIQPFHGAMNFVSLGSFSLYLHQVSFMEIQVFLSTDYPQILLEVTTLINEFALHVLVVVTSHELHWPHCPVFAPRCLGPQLGRHRG